MGDAQGTEGRIGQSRDVAKPRPAGPKQSATARSQGASAPAHPRTSLNRAASAWSTRARHACVPWEVQQLPKASNDDRRCRQRLRKPSHGHGNRVLLQSAWSRITTCGTSGSVRTATAIFTICGRHRRRHPGRTDNHSPDRSTSRRQPNREYFGNFLPLQPLGK